MKPARKHLAPHLSLPRHRHAETYAAVVLSGGYHEAGDMGRRRVAYGDVVFHRAFEAHADIISSSGAELVNLPFARAYYVTSFARIADADEIVRQAERDVAAAGELLLLRAEPLGPEMLDWTDELAQDLREGVNIELRDWARRHGMAPETVSRGFRKAFGISPKRFRFEARIRAALRRLSASSESVTTIAADTGFADLAHLCRSVSEITGKSPGFWRR
jgi:AraC-like DNA-binding protein